MRFAIGSHIKVIVRPVRDETFVGLSLHWIAKSNGTQQAREGIGIVHPPVNLACSAKSRDLKRLIVVPAQQEPKDSALNDFPRMAEDKPEFGPPVRTLAPRLF